MDTEQLQFVRKAEIAAEDAGHPFPDMAACEAAEESRFGTSLLAIQFNNLFGMKAHVHQVYGTAILPTREFIGGEWKVVDADWVRYPDWRSCFRDRYETLKRLSIVYAHYGAALATTDPERYVIQVSQSWSTDPGPPPQYIPGLGRANKVLAIYHEYTGAPSGDSAA